MCVAPGMVNVEVRGCEDLRDRNRHHRSIKETTTIHLMRFHTFGTKDRAGNGSGAVIGVAHISRGEVEMGRVGIG